MRSKIFNTTLYAIIMVLGIHTLTFSQDAPSKEKAMEDKMAQMEQRLKEMQSKLDSIKLINKLPGVISIRGQAYRTTPGGMVMITDSSVNTLKLNGQLFTAKALKPFKAAPHAVFKAVPAPATIVQGYSYDNGNTKTFTTTTRSSSNTFTYTSLDKNLEEKIKNGEIKEKTKAFTKTYSVKSGDKLQINNSYGKVTVNTWNKSEFKVEIEIRGIANEEDDAQKLLDGINITDSKDDGVISFTTKIESQNHQWGSWSNNGKSYVNKVIVNYTVYMPSKSALEIKNRFGAVTLPDFGGKLLINTQYGSFTAKELTNTENDINTRFTDVNIQSINGSVIRCEYGNGGGGIKIGSANNLKLNAGFIAADILRIKNSGDISVRYGDGLKISDLDKNVKVLNVNSSFAPVILGSKNNFDFSVVIKMGSDLKYDDDHVKITNKTPEDNRRFSSTKTYTGYAGKSNSDTKVNISSSYQTVQIL